MAESFRFSGKLPACSAEDVLLTELTLIGLHDEQSRRFPGLPDILPEYAVGLEGLVAVLHPELNHSEPATDPDITFNTTLRGQVY